MPLAQLIMDPSGSDPIVVLDCGKQGVHYVDLTNVVGFTVNSASLKIYLIGSEIFLQGISSQDGERIVERWLSLRKVH